MPASSPASQRAMCSAAGERFAAALTEHLETIGPDGTLVVVSHGGVTRAGAFRFLGLPREFWESFGGLSNCSWAVLEERDLVPTKEALWRVVEWNAGTLPEPVLSDEEPAG